MNMFWCSSGWKDDRIVSPEDFAYAKKQGAMFDFVALSHDEAVEAAVDAVALTTREAVARAFVASLSTRQLGLRSALGSYAVGRHMRKHPRDGARCAYCGECEQTSEPNILNFERLKWGGVRHASPRYIALDLQALAAEGGAVPSDHDWRILRAILQAARTVGAAGRLGDLERALSGLFPSNNSERRTLIGILGYAGILIDPARPDFRRGFVPESMRQHTPWAKDDWPYPVQWWSGPHGVSEAAVDEWFPELAVDR